MENPQRNLLLLGDVKRPMHEHNASVIAACKSKADACRVALTHSRLTQEAVAAQLFVSKGYLSLLLGGKKRWTDDMQFRFEQVTRSLAPAQWDAARRGLSMYVDDVAVRRAQLLAELNEIDQAA